MRTEPAGVWAKVRQELLVPSVPVAMVHGRCGHTEHWSSSDLRSASASLRACHSGTPHVTSVHIPMRDGHVATACNGLLACCARPSAVRRSSTAASAAASAAVRLRAASAAAARAVRTSPSRATAAASSAAQRAAASAAAACSAANACRHYSVTHYGSDSVYGLSAVVNPNG